MAPSPSLTSVIKPSNGRVYSPDRYSGSDTARILACFKAANKDPYSLVYLPWAGKPYLLEDTAVSQDPSNDYCCYNVVGDPAWCLIDFKAPDGYTAFKRVGMKNSDWCNVMMRTWGNGHVGFSDEGTDQIRSCGTMWNHRLRVQFVAGIGSTGFLCGVGGDDFSADVWNMCEAYGPADHGSNLAADYLKYVAGLNHRGFVFNGGNNLYQRLDNCHAVDCKVAVSQLWNGAQQGPGQSGASGLYVTNFGTTACNLIFQADGGFSFFAHGGRHELGGALLSHGNPTGWQKAQTVVRLTDLVVDALRPYSGAETGLFEPGAVISLRSDSKYRFQGITMGQDNGEQLKDGEALYLAHNGPVPARVSFEDCQLTFDPAHAKKVAGSWYVAWDGAVIA